MSTPENGWHRSRFCSDAGCIEVAPPSLQAGAWVVPVRWTGDPADVHFAPLDAWRQKAADTRTSGRFNPDTWRAAGLFGPWADQLTAKELTAFGQEVLAGGFSSGS